MKQAVDCDFILYPDNSCLVYQRKYVKEIERNLKNDFSDVCDWFVGNKLSIHLGEDNTKCILFGTNIDLIKSVVLIFNMVRYTLSNTTQ